MSQDTATYTDDPCDDITAQEGWQGWLLTTESWTEIVADKSSPTQSPR